MQGRRSVTAYRRNTPQQYGIPVFPSSMPSSDHAGPTVCSENDHRLPRLLTQLVFHKQLRLFSGVEIGILSHFTLHFLAFLLVVQQK